MKNQHSKREKRPTIVTFDFKHNSKYNRWTPTVTMTQYFLFGLISRKKVFHVFTDGTEGFHYLYISSYNWPSFPRLFDAAKAANEAFELYRSANRHKNFRVIF